MEEYLHGVLTRQVDGYVLVERETSTGKRLGWWRKSTWRPTITGPAARRASAPRRARSWRRIPPRVKIRENAPLETPHAMLLADDPGRTLIEPLYARRDSFELLYDFDLMQGGGHIRGWRVDGAQNAQIEEAARALEKEGLAFAVGDGNHSLAAARRCWELSGEPLARWALVEIVNVYDEALVFEPIHRAIFGGDAASLRAALRARFPAGEGRGAAVRRAGGRVRLRPGRVAAAAGRVGAAKRRRHRLHPRRGRGAPPAAEGAASLLLPVIPKEELFAQVRLHGALPRKAFSMARRAISAII